MWSGWKAEVHQAALEHFPCEITLNAEIFWLQQINTKSGKWTFNGQHVEEIE